MLECIAAWGLSSTVARVIGMFAIALWDRCERRLFLARDRFGEKPLYYGWVGGDFVFGSELKSIRRHRRFDNRISADALRQLAGRAYIPAPLSIYEGIYKLEPGCILSLDRKAARTPLSSPPQEGAAGSLTLERYWSYPQVLENGLLDPILDKREAIDRLEQALFHAVAGQAVADVPVGAFLSGGVDSSTVVALYQTHSPGRVKTFTIGFEEKAFDEAGHAREVARYFATDHHECYVSSENARDLIPRLPQIYDEPFADSSQIPTHLVSALASQHVTVALSGDGADELFGGYNRYRTTARLWSHLKRIPRPFRAAIGAGACLVPGRVWDAAAALIPEPKRPVFVRQRAQKLARTLREARTLKDFADSYSDQWARDRSPVLPHAEVPNDRFHVDLSTRAPDALRLMASDAVTYLPDDILCKVDRAAMAVSLETRIPFLDHRVAELAARIPLSMQMANGGGKLLLRKVLYRHAPRYLFERPKSGFAIPVAQWMKGPLRAWAEDLFNSDRLRSEGLFDADRVQRRWRAHLAGEEDASQPLWTILMFQAWLAEQH